MKISFNELANSLSVNHEKENTIFLLSDKITECLNTLTKDNFFVLESKENDTRKNIYIDKGFFHKIKNELLNVIKDYTKGNLYHLGKVFSANNIYKINSPAIFSDKDSFSFSNLDSLDNVRDFISKLINRTSSSTLKDNVFNKDKCPTIHMFFKKGLFTNSEVKSFSLLIKKLSNKTRVLNIGCELPYQLDNKNNILLVKFGDLKAADYKVKPNDEYYQPLKEHSCKGNKNNILLVKFGDLKAADYKVKPNDEYYQPLKEYSCKDNNINKIKSIITDFEINFNFLNEYIRQYHKIVDNSCFFENIKEVNEGFNFIDGNVIENIKKSYYKCDDLLLFNNEFVSHFNEINNNCNELDLFYQKNIFNLDDDAILNLDVDNLECKLKKIKSNTDLLKLKIESLNDFSTCVSQCNNEFKNKLSYLEKNSKKIVCDSIIKIKEKTNECLSLLDGFIKRKETGFLSKVYKFFFPEKHNESLNLLIDYKSEVNKISSYFENYKENKYLSIDEIGLITTSNLSKINYPESLLGYLYGENRKCDNFIQSLFKKNE